MPQIDIRYFTVIAVAAVVTIGSVIGVNYFIDPYDRLGNNRIGHYLEDDRSAKVKQVQVYPHDSLLLGSSKVGFIDPAALGTSRRFYNAGFVGVMPEELLSFLRHYGAKEELVVIGFDLYMFNLTFTAMLREDRFADLTGEQGWAYLASVDTLSASLDTVWRRLSDEPPGLEFHGQRNPWRINRVDAPFTKPSHEKVLGNLRTQHYGNFVFAEERIAILRDIRALLVERKQPHIVFLNPVHRSELALLREISAGEGMKRLRQEVKQIFPLAIDLSDGNWSGDEAYFNSDPFHYRPETGTAFMRDLLKQCPVDGVSIGWRGC
ncbi:MAG: hypothetical protein OJJ21_00140 [Ferrovibrio sp.]|uniref:hypothetical protein n=1 Tax=Ferrovibrio sp. TaxID=1917215 RepID=UPI00262760A6|nr:hypothetical protein [Ferrovibrio sp.]MCW0231989.1 hypothetical protein [Ferrovibrio sp.]